MPWGRLMDLLVALGARRVRSCPNNPTPHYHPNVFGRWLLRGL
jgi:hypothetical protein